MTTPPTLQSLLDEIEVRGILLESDGTFPSLVGMIAGEPIRGSWWGHPLGGEIYNALQEFANHPDVMSTRLILGKITFVHRRLWPALYAVGVSGGPWQTRRMSDLSRVLLTAVWNQGELRTDRWAYDGATGKKIGDAARELEKRLAVVAWQIHTEKGSHAKALESWEHWRERIGLDGAPLDPGEAAALLADALDAACAPAGRAPRMLPWE